MKDAKSRNFHLPLSEGLYDRLRDEAQKRGRPATAVARQALEAWLAQQHRMELHESIAAYARQEAGGPADLDPELEESGLESLREDE
jgi:hypothetical protein